MAGEGLNLEQMGLNGLGFRVVSPVEEKEVRNRGYGGTEEINVIKEKVFGNAMPRSEAEQTCDELNKQLELSENPKLRKRKAKIVEDNP